MSKGALTREQAAIFYALHERLEITGQEFLKDAGSVAMPMELILQVLETLTRASKNANELAMAIKKNIEQQERILEQSQPQKSAK